MTYDLYDEITQFQGKHLDFIFFFTYTLYSINKNILKFFYYLFYFSFIKR